MGFHGDLSFLIFFGGKTKNKFQIFLFVILTLMEFIYLFFVVGLGEGTLHCAFIYYSMSHGVTILLVLDLFCIFPGRVRSW